MVLRLLQAKWIFLSLIVVVFSGCATFNLETSVTMTRDISIKDRSEKKLYLNTHYELIDKVYYDQFVQSMSKELINKGYSLVDNTKDADYNVTMNVLFAHNIKEANAALNATKEGFTNGLTTGLKYAKTLEQAAALSVASAITMGTAAVGLEDKTYNSVVDVFIQDKNKNEKTRVFAQTVQLRLTKEEALPVLMDITSKHILDTLF